MHGDVGRAYVATVVDLDTDTGSCTIETTQGNKRAVWLAICAVTQAGPFKCGISVMEERDVT